MGRIYSSVYDNAKLELDNDEQLIAMLAVKSNPYMF